MTPKDKKIVKHKAECKVISSESSELIVTFDRAWHHALTLPRPVLVSFTRFVRVDET